MNVSDQNFSPRAVRGRIAGDWTLTTGELARHTERRARAAEPAGRTLTAAEHAAGAAPVARLQAEELITFVPDRLLVAGTRGPGENLAAGDADLLSTYAEILPRLDDAGPYCDAGVADGLGQALRYVARAWHHHPDFQTCFASQAPATSEAWRA
ncbi:hypothetical protein ACFW6S_35295 [Streptomyces sp. NPDC058740]|uniref:hypothetical protein n=1 Tax=Streptomyces sp. NPDC058740 TaxID=3346619 RepID=UPI0036AD4BE4